MAIRETITIKQEECTVEKLSANDRRQSVIAADSIEALANGLRLWNLTITANLVANIYRDIDNDDPSKYFIKIPSMYGIRRKVVKLYKQNK